jgi:ATP-dependent Zn protease
LRDALKLLVEWLQTKIKQLSDKLMEKETLDGKQIREILG